MSGLVIASGLYCKVVLCQDLLVLVICSGCARTYYVCYAVVHNVALTGDPGLLCKGKQSCGKLHSIQDLRKEATPVIGVHVQLLLGIACEACGSCPHCLILALNGAAYSPLVSRTPP